MKINEIEQDLEDLYYNSKIEECLNKADAVMKNHQTFKEIQVCSIYKALCLFAQGNSIEGRQCFEEVLNDPSLNQLDDKVDRIDISLRIHYFWQLRAQNFIYHEGFIDNFTKCCEQYKHQNVQSDHFDLALYLCGIATTKYDENTIEENFDEIIKSLEHSLQLTAGKQKHMNQEIMNIISYICILNEKYDRAFDLMNQLLQENKNFPNIENNLAICYSAKGLDDQVQELYLSSLERNPSNIITLNSLAHYYQKKGRQGGATNYFEISYKLNPKLSSTCAKFANFLFESGDEERARQILLDCIQNDPKSAETQIELFEIEYASGNIEKAAEYIEKSIELNPKEYQYQFRKIEFLMGNQQFSEAEQLIKRILSQRMNQHVLQLLYSDLSECYVQLNQLDKTISTLLEGIGRVKNYQEYCYFVELVCNIFDDDYILDEKTKVNIIESLDGPIIPKLQYLIDALQNQTFINILKSKLDTFRSFLFLSTYNREVLSQLTFLRQFTHWDLLLE